MDGPAFHAALRPGEEPVVARPGPGECSHCACGGGPGRRQGARDRRRRPGGSARVLGAVRSGGQLVVVDRRARDRSQQSPGDVAPERPHPGGRRKRAEQRARELRAVRPVSDGNARRPPDAWRFRAMEAGRYKADLYRLQLGSGAAAAGRPRGDCAQVRPRGLPRLRPQVGHLDHGFQPPGTPVQRLRAGLHRSLPGFFPCRADGQRQGSPPDGRPAKGNRHQS